MVVLFRDRYFEMVLRNSTLKGRKRKILKSAFLIFVIQSRVSSTTLCSLNLNSFFWSC